MLKLYSNPGFKEDLKSYYIAFTRLNDKYHIGSKVVGDIGEYFAKEVCGVRLGVDKNLPNIDGIDTDGKRVQIKTRHRHKSDSKIHVFRPFNKKKLNELDYALLIILDEEFWLEEIWKVERKTLQEYFKNMKSDGFNLTSGIKTREGVKRIY